MLEAVPRQPRRDDTAADVGSLERMGRIDPQPVPAPAVDPFLEPDPPPPDGDGEWPTPLLPSGGRGVLLCRFACGLVVRV